jgi:hypothetical protein
MILTTMTMMMMMMMMMMVMVMMVMMMMMMMMMMMAMMKLIVDLRKHFSYECMGVVRNNVLGTCNLVVCEIDCNFSIS